MSSRSTLSRGRLGPVASRTIILFILCYLVLVPLAVLVFSSLRDGGGGLPFGSRSSWSWVNFSDVFLESRTYELILNTVILSVGSLIIAFAISLYAAWLVERTNMPARGFVFVMIIAGIGTPGFISAIAWTLLLNPSNGAINVGLRSLFGLEGDGPLNILTMPGMIVVEGLGLVPVTFLLLTAAFRALDVSLEDAGALSGANPRSVAKRITLPLLTPAILSAFVYQLATTIESFDVPVTLGLRGGVIVLPTEIYLQVQPSAGLPNYGLASVYGLLLIAIVLMPLMYYQRIIGRSERFATVSGNSYRARRVELAPWAKVAGLTTLGVFVLLEFILPTLMLVYTSLQSYYSVPSLESIANSSLDAYRTLFADPTFHSAFWNTMKVALITGVATMTLAAVVSWFIVRSRTWFRSVLDLLAYIPHAIPALVMGLSIALIYLYVAIPIYGTFWIIVVALMTRYISLASRQMNTGLISIKRELEEASSASGGSPFQTFRRVLLPLALPAYTNGFLLVALLAIKNLSMALVLGGQDNTMLSTIIWSYWDNGHTAETGAMSVIMVAITLVLGIMAYVVGQDRAGTRDRAHRRGVRKRARVKTVV